MVTFQSIYQLITLTITALTALFLAYNYLKNPQTRIEKKQAIDNEKEQGKVAILNAQLDWQKETAAQQLREVKDDSERRFKDVNDKLTEVLRISQNHIHTVEVKVDALSNGVNEMNLSLSKDMAILQTLIAERMPCKKKQ
jgi:hypothetical protein